MFIPTFIYTPNGNETRRGIGSSVNTIHVYLRLSVDANTERITARAHVSGELLVLAVGLHTHQHQHTHSPTKHNNLCIKNGVAGMKGLKDSYSSSIYYSISLIGVRFRGSHKTGLMLLTLNVNANTDGHTKHYIV